MVMQLRKKRRSSTLTMRLKRDDASGEKDSGFSSSDRNEEERDESGREQQTRSLVMILEGKK